MSCDKHFALTSAHNRCQQIRKLQTRFLVYESRRYSVGLNKTMYINTNKKEENTMLFWKLF